MQVTVEKLSPVLVELHVTVPVERVQASLKKAFDNVGKSAHIKGFRKGKAPQHVLRHVFGERIHADVASRLVEDTLDAAMQQQQLRPLSKPQVERPVAKEDEAFAYRARFEVTPEIGKVDYEAMRITRPSYPVDEASVDKEIEKLRDRHATLKDPEPMRPAQKQDTVVFDFELTVGGKVPEGGKAENVSAVVGDNMLVPELGQALEGKEVGAQFDVEADFGDNYQRKELVGKHGVFHVVVKQIKQKVLPEVDDEFAKDVGSFDNLEALRADLRAKLEKAAQERAETEMAQAVVVELCKRNPVPVPPSLVQQQAKLQENEILQQARAQGHQVRDLSPDLKEGIRKDAETKVRAGLLMAEIAKASNMKIGDAEVEKAYVDLAEQTGQNINRVKAQYRTAQQRELLFAMILEDMVLTKILDAAVIEGAAKPAEATEQGDTPATE